MKNGDMPAMPIELNGFGQFAPEAYIGMTKRETFAMHFAGHIWTQYQTDGTAAQHDNWREGVCVESVRLADALLAELECTK
jgi:hypothetical protein